MEKAEFSNRYSTVLHEAARLAKQRRSPLIKRKDLFDAVRGMSPQIFNRLLGCKHLRFPEELSLADEQDTETEPSLSSETYRILSLHGGVLGNVMETMGEESPIDLPHLAAALLLDFDSESPVRELCRINGIEPAARKAEILGAARKLCRIRNKDIEKKALKNVSFLRAALQKKLVGQDETIEKLAMGLWQFWTRPPEECTRPLSIFIGGAAGSGLTLCAETLMTSIAQLTGKPKIAILNAGMFSSRDSSRDVFGMNASWKGGPLVGKCTGPIYENPHGVVCLKYVEALHPIALSHILTAITTGRLKDEGLDKTVDFKNAIFLFISSAGGEGLTNSASAGNAVPMTKSRLAEVLCHNIPDNPNARRNILALVQQCTLCVTMKPLDVAGIRTLTRRTVVDEIGKFKRRNCKINMDADAVADILVQSISSLDARAIPSMVAEAVEPLRKTMLKEPDTWRKLKTLEVMVEGASPLDVSEVSKNLHMRKRLNIQIHLACKDKTATLTISAQGYSMLPAITDGLIRVPPLQDSDSFARLVGISAPLAYAKRWARFFDGQTTIKPESLLLVGPPGCGKTSFARSLASYLSKPFAVLKCSDISSAESLLNAFASIRKYAGEGLLVFLDEIDSLGGDRSDKSEAYIERLNLFLQQIDGFETNSEAKILWIAATNRIHALDEALIRPGRFGQTVVFAPLGKSERRQLVALALEECKIAIDEEVANFMAETTEDFTGATIKAICREMALAVENTRPTKQDYLRARQVVLDGMFTQRPCLDEAETFAVATHEAGHALCCLRNGFPFVQASIVATGNNLGFLERMKLGLASQTKSGLIAAMDISLAGRAAQEVVLGQATAGAKSDNAKATVIAQQYIGEGFSDEYGIGIPPDGLSWKEISPIVRKLLDSRYAHVKQQFCKEKPLLLRIANLLVQRKVVCEDEIQACCVQYSQKERQASHE